MQPPSPATPPQKTTQKTIAPPYYAVIFTSTRTDGDHGYDQTADRMMELAARQPGYLGVDSARGADGLGITVSYWDSEESIARWKRNAEHLQAQESGQSIWYRDYQVRVAKVERAYGRQRDLSA
jgi:heme-degrading monooxygenase HmoA